MMKALLKILAVDDHQFFLKGISECFGALAITEQVDTCSTYKSLQLKLQQGLPDIVFLDLNMPEHDGFSICREIKRDHENVFVAMLTQYDSEKFVNKARQCGAGAYFIKNTEPEVFSRFLSNFKDGKIKDFFVHIPSTEKSPEFEGDRFSLAELLSHREQEVMKLLARGMGHKEIEKELHITYDTVKSHRSNILQKLKLENVAQLVKFALDNKIIDRFR